MGDSESDGRRDIDIRREAQGKEIEGLAVNAYSDVGEGCCYGPGVWR